MKSQGTCEHHPYRQQSLLSRDQNEYISEQTQLASHWPAVNQKLIFSNLSY